MNWMHSRTRNQSGTIQAPTVSKHARVHATVDTAPDADAPPNGGLAAAMFACGLACALFGVLVVAAERSETLADGFLAMSAAVGPLSGKAIVATAAYAVVWTVLHRRLRETTVDLHRWMRASLVLVAVGLVATFPPVFLLGVH